MCQRTGCAEPVTAYPIILVWAARDAIQRARDKAAQIRLDSLGHCKACSESTTVKDLITDEGWEVILKKFAMAGKAPPRRWSAKLEWQTIEVEKQND